jgi:hypothetical protein
MSSNNEMAEATGQLPQIARPPLLITESADEYAALLAALRQEIKPQGVIEHIYLEDLASTWKTWLRSSGRSSGCAVTEPALSTMPSALRCKVCYHGCC